MKVKSQSEVAQLCPTLSDPMDCSLPGSSAHGNFQARVLEWDAIAFSKVHASIDQKGRMIQRIYLRIKEDYIQGFKLHKIHPTGFEIVPDW